MSVLLNTYLLHAILMHYLFTDSDFYVLLIYRMILSSIYIIEGLVYEVGLLQFVFQGRHVRPQFNYVSLCGYPILIYLLVYIYSNFLLRN